MNRSSGVGGQAVIEGVMMRHKDTYAVAVRKPDGEIEVETEEFEGVLHHNKIKTVPFIRGVFNFLDSLILGMKTLTFSSSFYIEEEEKETKTDKLFDKLFKDKAQNVLMGITMAISIIMAVAIFMVLPYFLSSLFEKYGRFSFSLRT